IPQRRERDERHEEDGGPHDDPSLARLVRAQRSFRVGAALIAPCAEPALLDVSRNHRHFALISGSSAATTAPTPQTSPASKPASGHRLPPVTRSKMTPRTSPPTTVPVKAPAAARSRITERCPLLASHEPDGAERTGQKEREDAERHAEGVDQQHRLPDVEPEPEDQLMVEVAPVRLVDLSSRPRPANDRHRRVDDRQPQHHE